MSPVQQPVRSEALRPTVLKELNPANRYVVRLTVDPALVEFSDVAPDCTLVYEPEQTTQHAVLGLLAPTYEVMNLLLGLLV